MRKKEFIKPEIEIISFGTEDIIALSGLIPGKVRGSANYRTQGGMVSGNVGGISIFTD